LDIDEEGSCQKSKGLYDVDGSHPPLYDTLQIYLKELQIYLKESVPLGEDLRRLMIKQQQQQQQQPSNGVVVCDLVTLNIQDIYNVSKQKSRYRRRATSNR
jgi:hypothetical protein